MSRTLPSQPSLEYLKKQAKEWLAERRPRHPGWMLADAQHALAREYGFASWPKLKAHVESLAGAESPFAGTWRANVPMSERHPLNQFQNATLRVGVDGDTVTMAHVAVEESGLEDRFTNTVHTASSDRSATATV